MGNYNNIEIEFIERTLHLISQYEGQMHKYNFYEQYNHTLLVNCLLGLIVMPKERTISYLPNKHLGSELRKEMGVERSTFNQDIRDLKSLIIAMRHTIAHFNIEFKSDTGGFLIDHIIFKDRERGENYVVASFVSQELLNFIRYYGYWLVEILREHKSMTLERRT